jgi:hypothetical protein
MAAQNRFYNTLKSRTSVFDASEIAAQFSSVDEKRVSNLAGTISDYVRANVPRAFDSRESFSDYRTNPYVLMTSASVVNLNEPERFANFLFNTKLYMGLETSYGKSIESVFLNHYPINSEAKWDEPPEKIAEARSIKGLSREEKAKRRRTSVWREIDKSFVHLNRRYLVSIKSGPNTINDTQVQGMTDAIINNYQVWLGQSKENNKSVDSLDVVIGLTYGTDKTTNNKENQILAKLLDAGFVEEDRARYPGVLIDGDHRSVRVYRVIGKDFWAFIGNPQNPTETHYVFLEVLLGLAKGLSNAFEEEHIEDRINAKIDQLISALMRLKFPRDCLPDWIEKEFKEEDLFYFATAMSAFFDEGI